MSKNFSRKKFIALTGGVVATGLLAACGDTPTAAPAATVGSNNANKPPIIVGSKNFTESILIAQMYALALENAGIKVQRKLDLGSTDIAHTAIQKGDIGIYPEYTGTAVLTVLKLPKDSNDPKVVLDKMVKGYVPLRLTVLDAAPMNNTNGIAVTKAIADKYNLKNLSGLAQAAGELRFAAIADFVGPRSDTDGLGSLQRTYGGFKFKDVKTYDIPLRYQALLNNNADAVVAFSTDGEISGYNLVLMEDDKLNFPPYQFAPVVRDEVISSYPEVKTILNGVSAKITTAKISALNWKVDGPDKKEAIDVARDFLKTEGLIK